MKRKNDDFYDLRVARQLAERATRPLGDEAGDTPPRKPADYVKFSASLVREAGQGQAPPDNQLDSAAASGSSNASPWEEILAWCAEVAGAESAFAINASGLIAGHIPGRSAEEIEAIGSRVMIAIEQATRMGIDESEHLFLDLGFSWMSGLPILLPSGEAVAVCVVGGPWDLPKGTCVQIRDHVRNALS